MRGDGGKKMVEKFGISEQDLLEVIGKYPGFRREEFEKQRDEILSIPQLIRDDGSKGMLMAERSYEGSGVIIGGPLYPVEIQIDFPDLDIGSFHVDTRLARLGQDREAFTMEQDHYLVDGISTNSLDSYNSEQRDQILVWMQKSFEQIAQEYGIKGSSCVLLSERMTEIPFGQVKGKLEQTLENMLKASKKIKRKADEYVAKRLAPV